MSEDNIPLDENQLEYLLELQHQRYYHLQSLARGILGTIVAIAAILTTVIVSFYDTLFPFIIESTEYTNVARNLGISPDAAALFSLFNYLHVIIYLFLITITVLVLSVRLSDIVLGHPLMPQRAASQNYTLKLQASNSHTNTYTMLLYRSFQSNRKTVGKAHDRLITSGLRVVLLIALIASGTILFVNLSEQNLVRILLYDTVFSFAVITPAVLKQLLSVEDPDQVPQSESSLAQEVFYEDRPDSRWSKLSTYRFEEVLFSMTTVISGLAILVFLASWFS